MGAGRSSTPDYSEKTKNDIDNAIATPLVVFSMSWCSYCHKVKQTLRSYEPFILVEVDQMGGSNVTAEYKAYLSELTGKSRITWPRVFINGKCIGGCDETTNLKNKGQLDKLINDAKNSSKL